MRIVWRPVLLLLAAAPAFAQDAPAGGGIEVAASCSAADGRNVVRVSGRAPLPDNVVLGVALTYDTNAPGHPPFVTRRARVRGGAFAVEVDDRQEEFFPGVYRVGVRVEDDDSEEARGLSPELRRASGAARVRVGSVAAPCEFVNATAAKVLPDVRTLLEGYPALATLFDRALKKDLGPPEWQRWFPGNKLGPCVDRLSGLLYSRGVKLALPASSARIQSLVHEFHDALLYVPFILDGKYDPANADSELGLGITALRGRLEKEAKAGAAPLPATADVDAVLFAEGRGVYATACGRAAEEMEMVFQAAAGKEAGDGATESARLAGVIGDLRGLFEKFAALDWSLDAKAVAAQSRPMEEAFAALKALLDEHDRVRAGKVSGADSALDRLRKDLREKLAPLVHPVPPGAQGK